MSLFSWLRLNKRRSLSLDVKNDFLYNSIYGTWNVTIIAEHGFLRVELLFTPLARNLSHGTFKLVFDKSVLFKLYKADLLGVKSHEPLKWNNLGSYNNDRSAFRDLQDTAGVSVPKIASNNFLDCVSKISSIGFSPEKYKGRK